MAQERAAPGTAHRMTRTAGPAKYQDGSHLVHTQCPHLHCSARDVGICLPVQSGSGQRTRARAFGSTGLAQPRISATSSGITLSQANLSRTVS